MSGVTEKAREFILTNARLLERKLFAVRFDSALPGEVAQAVRAYQNADGGFGDAMEPDIRCSESQPIFIGFGLSAMEEAGCLDLELANSVLPYLEAVSAENGLVPVISETALHSPIAGHWKHASLAGSLNPTAEICGLLHYQGVQHEWLFRATETCTTMLMKEMPSEAHTLHCALKLAEYMPDRSISEELLDRIASVLPRASFFLPMAPVDTYGLTPLHFAPKPDSLLRPMFTQDQIDEHLEDLLKKQQPDGGWPISWEAPGSAAVLEWRGRWTVEALSVLSAYGVIVAAPDGYI